MADNVERWKIPGASLRGVFKAWMSRLAARDGEALVDSAGSALANEERKVVDIHGEISRPDVILDLFGSLKKRGRIHIADAYSSITCDKDCVQNRAHVVIDRFSGGTNDGKLFKNAVLTDPGQRMEFESVISIRSPHQREVDWLSRTLQALHLGLIRLGSSKSAGRLEIKKVEVLSNPAGAVFNPEFKEN